MDKNEKQALVTERVKLFEENKRDIAVGTKEKRELTGEEQGKVDERFARIDAIKRSLETADRMDAEERALSESGGRRTSSDVRTIGEPTAEDQQLAFRGWAMGRHATPEMLEAAQRCGVNVNRPSIDMAPIVRRDEKGAEVRTFIPVSCDGEGNIRGGMEARALSVGTTTAGGNSVPNEVMRAFYEVQKWYGAVREQATVVMTESGSTLPWPIVTDTSNTGAILAEATAATTTADPTFSVVNILSYKFSSKAVLVSWELLQDSFIDLSSYLGTALGRRIGRIQNNKFTVGAGTTEPTGLITGATTSAAAATNAFTLDEVITLIHALDPAYRSLPGTGFTVHDTIAAYLRKFKDGQGRYLWEMSTQVGQPDRLFGFPVTINNDMDSALTTGKKLLYFGNVKLALIVRDAGAVRFVRSDEKYILEHQVMFEASQRSSSEVIDTTAGKVLTLA